MGATRYFEEEVLRKRPYLSVELCEGVLDSPVRSTRQDDGRIRFWGWVRLPNESEPCILRVVTLDDGKTLHNAFLDRGFRED